MMISVSLRLTTKFFACRTQSWCNAMAFPSPERRFLRVLYSAWDHRIFDDPSPVRAAGIKLPRETKSCRLRLMNG
jgi:hypothetical protein